MGELICVCKEAKTNCYLLCAKGRRIEPDKVYNHPRWERTHERSTDKARGSVRI